MTDEVLQTPITLRLPVVPLHVAVVCHRRDMAQSLHSTIRQWRHSRDLLNRLRDKQRRSPWSTTALSKSGLDPCKARHSTLLVGSLMSRSRMLVWQHTDLRVASMALPRRLTTAKTRPYHATATLMPRCQQGSTTATTGPREATPLITTPAVSPAILAFNSDHSNSTAVGVRRVEQVFARAPSTPTFTHPLFTIISTLIAASRHSLILITLLKYKTSSSTTRTSNRIDATLFLRVSCISNHTNTSCQRINCVTPMDINLPSLMACS